MPLDLEYKIAIVKFNGGNGALICNKCHVIIKLGLDHEDKKHFCDKHKGKHDGASKDGSGEASV